MDKLIADISAYAAARGCKPQAVLRAAYGAGWGVWEAWLQGKSTPTYAVGDRIYAYMAANPPTSAATDPEQDEAA